MKGTYLDRLRAAGLSGKDANTAYDVLTTLFREELVDGDGRVTIQGIGRIQRTLSAARKYRVPGTTETKSRPPKWVLRMHSTDAFEQEMNAKNPPV